MAPFPWFQHHVHHGRGKPNVVGAGPWSGHPHRWHGDVVFAGTGTGTGTGTSTGTGTGTGFSTGRLPTHNQRHVGERQLDAQRVHHVHAHANGFTDDAVHDGAHDGGHPPVGVSGGGRVGHVFLVACYALDDVLPVDDAVGGVQPLVAVSGVQQVRPPVGLHGHHHAFPVALAGPQPCGVAQARFFGLICSRSSGCGRHQPGVVHLAPSSCAVLRSDRGQR